MSPGGRCLLRALRPPRRLRGLRAPPVGAGASRGLLAGPESSVSARLRLASWREALHCLNIARSTTVFGDWSAASGWQKTFELLHLQPRISAIVVANDQMALGVLSALAQLNRSGSQAVSVTGYDDTADSLYFQPPLTTVAQDSICWARAVERLIA